MILQKLRTALDQKLKRFLNKDYRDGYLETHVRTGIALQIRGLRVKSGMSQEEFAVATGKKQSTVSRLENTDYGRVSVQTLLDVAAATGVALLVRFVDYPQFLRITGDMSERALAPENIFESQARSARNAQAAILSEAFGSWRGLEDQSQQEAYPALRQESDPVGQWARQISAAHQPSEAPSWN